MPLHLLRPGSQDRGVPDLAVQADHHPQPSDRIAVGGDVEVGAGHPLGDDHDLASAGQPAVPTDEGDPVLSDCLGVLNANQVLGGVDDG